MPHIREGGPLSDFWLRDTNGNLDPAGVLCMAEHNALSLPNLCPARLPGPAAAAQLLSGLPAPLGSTGAWPAAPPAPPPVAAPASAFLGSTQGEVKRQRWGIPPSAIHLGLRATLSGSSSLTWDEEHIPHLPVPLVPQTAKQKQKSPRVGSGVRSENEM